MKALIYLSSLLFTGVCMAESENLKPSSCLEVHSQQEMISSQIDELQVKTEELLLAREDAFLKLSENLKNYDDASKAKRNTLFSDAKKSIEAVITVIDQKLALTKKSLDLTLSYKVLRCHDPRSPYFAK